MIINHQKRLLSLERNSLKEKEKGAWSTWVTELLLPELSRDGIYAGAYSTKQMIEVLQLKFGYDGVVKKVVEIQF